MSNNSKLINQYIQLMWGKELRQSLFGVTEVLETYQNMVKGFPSIEVMRDLAETIATIKPYYINAIDIDTEVLKAALGTLSTINASAFAPSDVWITTLNRILKRNESFTYIKEISASMLQATKSWAEVSKILEQIESIPEDEIEMMMEGTEFTKEEVFEDIKDLKEEFLTSKDSESAILLKDRWENFWRNHPALANMLFIMRIVVAISAGILDLYQIADLVKDGTQNTIVSLQGCEDIFFIKVDSAKLYTAPDSYSKVITKILYAEQVIQVDSVNLWDKVIYINPEGEEIEGWIAKRNLMTYRDYQFNSEDLYNVED